MLTLVYSLEYIPLDIEHNYSHFFCWSRIIFNIAKYDCLFLLIKRIYIFRLLFSLIYFSLVFFFTFSVKICTYKEIASKSLSSPKTFSSLTKAECKFRCDVDVNCFVYSYLASTQTCYTSSTWKLTTAPGYQTYIKDCGCKYFK